jgi:hypothetical protein
MDLRSAFKGQYHGGLAMLRQCVEVCPENIWVSGEHPRNFWRIAFHAVFYTHLYLGQNEEAFVRWEKDRETCSDLWEDEGERVPVLEPYTKGDILEYLDKVDGSIDITVDGLDLDSEVTGFSWYKNMTKLDHEIMNLRHLQGHVGQLSELLMAKGIETDWIAKRPRE